MGGHPPVPEPLDIKRFMSALLRASPRKGTYIVFAGNQFPKHLWNHWAPTLRAMGLSWQDLLKAVSEHADQVLAWAEGRVEWGELLASIWSSLERSARGERGEARRGRPRSLTEFFEA